MSGPEKCGTFILYMVPRTFIDVGEGQAVEAVELKTQT